MSHKNIQDELDLSVSNKNMKRGRGHGRVPESVLEGATEGLRTEINTINLFHFFLISQSSSFFVA